MTEQEYARIFSRLLVSAAEIPLISDIRKTLPPAAQLVQASGLDTESVAESGDC